VLGKIEFDDQPIEFENPNLRNLMAEVSTEVFIKVTHTLSPDLLMKKKAWLNKLKTTSSSE
jgi:hypothetical protein